METRECDLCGERGTPVSVYQCGHADVGGLVTLGRYTTNPNRRLPTCLSCEHRSGRSAGEPIRVGLLLPVFCTGGVERWVMGLAKNLPPDIRIAGVGLTPGGMIHEASVAEAKRWFPFASPVEIARKSDVLIVWGIKEAIPIAEGFHGPIVLASHGNCSWTRDMLARNVARATHLAAVSEEAAKPFPADMRSRVMVIPNGAEVDRLSPTRDRAAVRKELGIADGAIVVGFVGRFSPEKNPLAVATAVNALGDSAVALYVGCGWDEERFRSEAIGSAAGRVRFVAPPPHLGDYYQAMDCLMVPSPAEGFGLVIAEGWLSRVPVVATNVGIVPEAERQFGPLTHRIDFTRPEAFPEAILSAVNPSSRSVTALAFRVAWENYTAAAMGRRWGEFLREILSD